MPDGLPPQESPQPQPDDQLGGDFGKSLDSKVLYEQVKSGEDATAPGEGNMVLKLDFESVDAFMQFAGQGREWQGSKREQDWIGDQIYSRDRNIRIDEPLTLNSIQYKDSVFDERPVVVVIVSYKQGV